MSLEKVFLLLILSVFININSAFFAIISVYEKLGCVPVGIKFVQYTQKPYFIAINAQIA